MAFSLCLLDTGAQRQGFRFQLLVGFEPESGAYWLWSLMQETACSPHVCLVSPLKWTLSPSPSPHSHLQHQLFPGLGCTILGLIFLLPQRLRFGQGGGAMTISDAGLTSSPAHASPPSFSPPSAAHPANPILEAD